MKTTLLRCLSLAIFGFLITSVSHGADAPLAKLPADVERLVRWLPEDTESLVVTRSTPLQIDPELKDLRHWSDLAVKILLDNNIDYMNDYFDPIRSNTATLAVRGARHIEAATDFGGRRAENCTIFILANDLDNEGRSFVDGLRRRATAVRNTAGRDVFAFPSVIQKEIHPEPASWEGSFFVLIDPRTLLHATSDRYLADVLRRMDCAPAGRALPETLPEWLLVDMTAPVWVLHHFAPGRAGAGAVGMTASLRDSIKISYVARPRGVVDAGRVRAEWAIDHLDVETRARCHLEQTFGGTLMLTIDGPVSVQAPALALIWEACRLGLLDWEQ